MDASIFTGKSIFLVTTNVLSNERSNVISHKKNSWLYSALKIHFADFVSNSPKAVLIERFKHVGIRRPQICVYSF